MNSVRSNSFQKIVVVGLALLALCSCKSQPPTRVLFIGNSYTFVNGGIDKQLGGLASSVETASIAISGYTLENHWADGNAVQTIRNGGWKYVVLQEQSQTPVVGQSKFFEFAKKFDDEIRKSGARTILLMTWERPDSVQYGITTANLAASFNALGMELSVSVAPAGLAFARSRAENSKLELYTQDGHPTVPGTYLAACVLYATIFRKSPVGNSYPFWDWNMSSETRNYLQKIAAASTGF